MRFGIDYAFQRPSNIAALHARGVTFVCRYLAGGHGGSKELTAQEARALTKAGIDIVVVWETTAGRTGEGRTAGEHDAVTAMGQAKRLGMPDDRPIYFAVDFDAAGDQVRRYFEGVKRILGARAGAYAGIRPVAYLLDHGLIRWAWQTYAWSSGKWDSRAQLRQVENGVTVAGVDADIDHAIAGDFGQWRVGVSPAWLGGGDRGPAVKRLVGELMWLGYLPWPVLGRPRSVYGGWVNTAVAHFQADHRLKPDTIAGPRTLTALEGTIAARRRAGYKPRVRPPLPPLVRK